MSRPSQIIINFLLFYALLLFAATLQSSLFHWVWSGRATFQISLCIITYVCLYRKPTEALLFTLLGSYTLGLLSSMLQSVSVFGGMCLFVLTTGIKNQLYNSSPVHFAWTALSNVFLFHIATWSVSAIFDTTAPQLWPLDWILEVLFTALVVRALYHFFILLDQKTKRIEVGELER